MVATKVKMILLKEGVGVDTQTKVKMIVFVPTAGENYSSSNRRLLLPILWFSGRDKKSIKSN